MCLLRANFYRLFEKPAQFFVLQNIVICSNTATSACYIYWQWHYFIWDTCRCLLEMGWQFAGS